MFKCLMVFIFMTALTTSISAPGYEIRGTRHSKDYKVIISLPSEKQTWHGDPWSHSKTAVRKQRDTKNLEYDVGFVKEYEITDLENKETFAISPLNDRPIRDQKFKFDINTLLTILNITNLKEKCNNNDCTVDSISDLNSNSEDRNIKEDKYYSNDDYYNTNQFYEDRSRPLPRDRRLPPSSYDDYSPPPPPHHYGGPPPPPHHHGGPPPPPPPHHHGELPPPPHHRGGPPPPPPPHHRGGPPPPPPPHHRGGPPPPPPPHHHGRPPPPPPPPYYDYYNYRQSEEDFDQPSGPPPSSDYDFRSRHSNPSPPPDYRDSPPSSFHGRPPPPPYGRPPPYLTYEGQSRPPSPPSHRRPSRPPDNYFDQYTDISYRSPPNHGSYDETKRMSDEERQTRQSSSIDNYEDNNKRPSLPTEDPHNPILSSKYGDSQQSSADRNFNQQSFDENVSHHQIVEASKMTNPLSEDSEADYSQIKDNGYMLHAKFSDNSSPQYNARYKEYSNEEPTSLSPFFFQVAAITPEEDN